MHHPKCLLPAFRSAPLFQLAFGMLKRADHILQKEAGLSHSQFKVLMLVEYCQPVTQIRLANDLFLTQAAISRLVEALIGKGLLESEVDKNNRRAHLLKTTAAGKATLAQCTKTILDLENKLFAALPESQLQTWFETIDQLLERVSLR